MCLHFNLTLIVELYRSPHRHSIEMCCGISSAEFKDLFQEVYASQLFAVDSDVLSSVVSFSKVVQGDSNHAGDDESLIPSTDSFDLKLKKTVMAVDDDLDMLVWYGALLLYPIIVSIFAVLFQIGRV